ncbi:MAG TPA: hypothetical protein DCE18_04865, partial [Syntrophobacteraceae bacterium]|nr:hypothetical protein [Syntrophobacteraceae bacterium]
MRRPRPFLGILLWSAVGAVLIALIAAGILTNTILRSVEKNLPNTLIEQLHDLAFIVEDLAELVTIAELTKAVPNSANFQRLRKKVSAVQAAIVGLRSTYVFDNLIQASAFHAVVAPAITDVQLWLSEGVSGYGPETETTIEVVLSRLTGAFQKARDLNHASENSAQMILNEQRDRLDRFLVGVNVLFTLALVITLIMVVLLIRQHLLQRREVEARQERERAEQSLRASEHQFRTLFNNAVDAIAIHDLEGHILEVNDVLCDRLGYNREELLRMTPMDIDAPDYVHSIPDRMNEVERKGNAFFETVHVRRDGSSMPVDVSSRMIDFGGRVAILSTARDITERKIAEEALHKSEERFRLLFNSISDAVFVHGYSDEGLPGRFIEVNDVACQRLGYSRDELLRMRPVDIGAPETFALVPEVMRKLWANKHVVWEGIHISKDGRKIPVEISNRLFDFEGKPTTFATVRDITERKQAEQALRESQERFQELAELLPETIFEMDASGRITFVNRNAFGHFGLSQDDFERGMNGFDMIAPEDRPRAIENSIRVMRGEKLGLNEYLALKRDGSTFPVIMHSTAKYLDGKPVGIRGIVIDITETKKLEAQLRQAHKMEAVGTLAGGIAHDFNNLLQAVQGYAELLLLKGREGDVGYRELQEISRAAKRGGELTRQLLMFSRKMESTLQPVDLNRVVEDLRMLLERTIPKMIEIELRLTGNLHAVSADISQIEQVLMNLAVNARDAMPDGGKLTIETRNAIADEEVRRSQPELTPGNYVALAVADTGQGMDKTTLEHVFDPFFTT